MYTLAPMRLVVALVALGLSAGSLRAQGLRVRLVDESAQPVSFALVTLLQEGRDGPEGLTRADGRRFFPADPNGRYAVRVRRPGFQAFTSAEFRVPSDTGAVSVTVSLRPAELRAERAPRECRADRFGPALAKLWEQASTTLRVTEIAAADGLEAIAIRRVERTFDRDGQTREESPMDGARLGSRLFRSATSAELSRRGFSYADPITGIPAFHGPGLQYLTSPEFLADHCFAPVEGTDGTAGLVGLSFEPRDGRSVVDIGGVMWFDPGAGELRFIDFAMRGAAGTASPPHGRLAFERLQSGIWIVRDWSLRTPVVTQSGQLLGFREESGEALQVSATMLAIADSIANSRKPPGRVNGVVMDSLVTRPLAGAIVTIDSAGPSARVDSSGAFWLRSVPAGYHRITVRHPLLDSIGTRPPTQVIRVGADSTTHVNLGGPSLATLKGGACHDSLAVLTGVVRDVASGQPIDSAGVTLSWIEIIFFPNQPLLVNPVDLELTTDATGRYAACVPAKLEITASAERGGTRTGRVDIRPDDRKLSVLHLSMDRSTSDTTIGSAAIQGVVMYQDRTPLANATVTLSDPERTTVTDSSGRFRIASIPGGTRVLDARAMGHAPVRTVVDARIGDTATVRIFMRQVTQLDAVVVRASAGVGNRALVELEERRRSGSGYRLTPVELMAFRGSGMDAVVRALPFVQVQYRQGYVRFLLRGNGSRTCTPNVWVDGRRSTEEEIGHYPARSVLAVEFFQRASEVPAQYRTFTECGAILLWTREGAESTSQVSRPRTTTQRPAGQGQSGPDPMRAPPRTKPGGPGSTPVPQKRP